MQTKFLRTLKIALIGSQVLGFLWITSAQSMTDELDIEEANPGAVRVISTQRFLQRNVLFSPPFESEEMRDSRNRRAVNRSVMIVFGAVGLWCLMELLIRLETRALDPNHYNPWLAVGTGAGLIGFGVGLYGEIEQQREEQTEHAQP